MQFSIERRQAVMQLCHADFRKSRLGIPDRKCSTPIPVTVNDVLFWKITGIPTAVIDVLCSK